EWDWIVGNPRRYDLSIAITSRRAISHPFSSPREHVRPPSTPSPTRRRSNPVLEMPWSESVGRPPHPATVACRVHQARLGGLPFVTVVQTAVFRSHHDAAGWSDGAFH